VGESPRPSPPLAPRPPGLETQGRPVCPFASHRFSRWPVRAPQGVRGPPLQPFPSYSGSLPRFLTMVFTGPSPVNAGYCAESYSPWLTCLVIAPAKAQRTREAAPPLERGTRCLPAFTPLPSRFFRLSPYEVPELGVRPARDRQGRTPGGATRRREGVSPSPVRPSYSAPRVVPVAGPPVSLSPLLRHRNLSTGRRRTRHRGMCSLCPAGGTCTPFPTLSP
jgi:hypothetical protein